MQIKFKHIPKISGMWAQKRGNDCSPELLWHSKNGQQMGLQAQFFQGRLKPKTDFRNLTTGILSGQTFSSPHSPTKSFSLHLLWCMDTR